MVNKIEITIDVIVHATEDISKIFQAFDEFLSVKEEEFTINEDGSYDFEAYPEGFFDQTQLESREIAKALITKQTKKATKNQ